MTPATKGRAESSLKAFFRIRPLDLSRPVSFVTLFGLSLVYASAYYLRPVAPLGAYFLPSRDLYHLIILPSSFAVLTGCLLGMLICAAARKWVFPRTATFGAIFVLSLLVLIALKGMFSAAGYDWRKLLPSGVDTLDNARYAKYLSFIVVVVVLWSKSGLIPGLTRGLSSLGFAFVALAAVHLVLIWRGDGVPGASTASGNGDLISPVAGLRHRRVVWVIFDETDFERTFPAYRDPKFPLENLNRLSQMAVFATNARSPASATLYSIPSLLTGVPLPQSGKGVLINNQGTLSQDLAEAGSLRFDEQSSIFGKLAAVGQSASVLGIYHPYCRLFTLKRCDSFPDPAIGGLDAALWANVPDALATRFTHAGLVESATRETLQLLPEYLERDDSLTFIHLGIPHLPSDYADRLLKLPANSDPLTQYAHNLILTDRVIGEITQALERRAAQQDILLIVSTDHWFRNMWYQPAVPEASKPVLFMAWRVGETQGITVSEQLSTVHTARMVLDYLSGKVSTQAEIALWWRRQPVYPSFIVPSSNGF